MEQEPCRYGVLCNLFLDECLWAVASMFVLSDCSSLWSAFQSVSYDIQFLSVFVSDRVSLAFERWAP